MKVLDPCCGSRMMWFDKNNPEAVFGDKRKEIHLLKDRKYLRKLEITPDVVMDFTNIPFPDNTFAVVVFDPPHLQRAGEKSWLAKKYGVLGNEWREDLRKGFAECFRVLRSEGVLIFKWSENQIPVKEILSLTNAEPLIGHVSMKHKQKPNADPLDNIFEGRSVMSIGIMIYLLICGLIGLALVVLALMSLIENWFKRRTKDVVLDACGMFWGMVVVLVAFLAILGVVK